MKLQQQNQRKYQKRQYRFTSSLQRSLRIWNKNAQNSLKIMVREHLVEHKIFQDFQENVFQIISVLL
jgi:hypothetical protein